VQLTLFPVDKPRGGTESLGIIPVVGSPAAGEHEETACFPGTWRTPYDRRILMMQPFRSRALLVALVRSPDMKPKRNPVSAKKGKLYHGSCRLWESGRFTRVLTSRLSCRPLLPRSVISGVATMGLTTETTTTGPDGSTSTSTVMLADVLDPDPRFCCEHLI